MSDSSDNVNKYYVNTPIAADYEGANSEVLKKASTFSKKSHRFFADKGKTVIDKGTTNFKYIEDTLFNNREVELDKNSSPSMFDIDYIDQIRKQQNCVYKVLRFDRSHNIRSFDFILNYSQVNSFGAEIYKPVVLNKQFIGHLLFTGCSIVRDTDTMEELPLKMYGKYESIGDTVNNNIDLDANVDAKGGPTFTFKYSFDNNYVYLFVSSLSPFRLIPTADGEFIDISYAEGKGSLIGETKNALSVIADPIVGSKKNVDYNSDNRIYADIQLSIKDTTISHDSNNIEFVDYDDVVMNNVAVLSRAQEFTLFPTNDGEKVVINMEPASAINMEITPNLKPIRFGSNLLNTSKESIQNYVNKLKAQIVECATNIEKIPFNIKTTIRSRGKYNINGNFFVDNQADSMGSIIIQDVGIYDNLTGRFDITEYIFDINQTKYEKANTAKRYKDYVNNASDYLTSITKNHPNIPSVRKTTELLDTILNIDFETPNELDVYFNAAFARSSVDFDVNFTFTEFGSNPDNNDDDYILYFCRDNILRVINFKDYEMSNILTVDIIQYAIEQGYSCDNTDIISSVARSEEDGKYEYYIGTSTGKLIVLKVLHDKTTEIKVLLAFNDDGVNKERISFIKYDNGHVYIGGVNGNISVYDTETKKIKYIKSIFKIGDEIIDVKNVDSNNIVVVSKTEINSYDLSSNKWNSEASDIIANSKFENPFKDLPYPNIDLILNKDGYKEVPVIQKDNYAYLLGMRSDRESGYSPVYKKVNLLTGETKELPLPTDDLLLYKCKLCKDERYIYCIGGISVPHINDPIEQRVNTFIGIFDTINDSWVNDQNNRITLNDGIVLNNNSDFYPTVNNGKIYISHPKASVITLNEDSGLHVMNTRRIYKTFIINVNDLSVSYLNEDEEIKLPTSDLNIVPLTNDVNKIHLFTGSPKIEQNEYKGYVLKRYILDTTNDTIIDVTEAISGLEYELSSLYDNGKFADVQNDLFANISVYSEYRESIIYCLDKFILYINSLDNLIYNEFHAISHAIGNNTLASHPPLLSSGDFSAWKKYNKKPINTIILHVGNYIAFVGGDTVRVADYLSLDSMSLIPASRYFERKKGVENSSIVIENLDKTFNIVPIDDSFEYDELSSCRINNDIYLLANVNIFEGERKTLLLKFEMDNSSSKPVIVKDLTQLLIDRSNYDKPYKVNMVAIGNKIFFSFINTIGTNRTLSNTYFNVVGYDIDGDTISYPITHSSFFADNESTYIYPICSNDVIYYVDDAGDGFGITINGNIIDVSNISNKFNITKQTKEYSDIKILKSITLGCKTYFYIPNKTNNRIDVLDSKTNTYKTGFVVPNSSNCIDGDIYHVDNTIYFTKGKCGNIITPDIYSVDLMSSDKNEIKRAILSHPSSEYNPVIVSRKNEVYLFGLNIDTKYLFRLMKSEINEKTFVKFSAEIKINELENTKYNKFNPTFTVFNVDGNEILAVFGGKESLGTPVTRNIDIYDVRRHVWKSGLELPVELSHFTVSENEIFGATEEVISSNTVVGYNKRLTIECRDYNTLDFTCRISDIYPNINGFEYPTYGKYTLDKENNLLFVASTDINDRLISNQMYKIDLSNNTMSYMASLPDFITSENIQFIGMVTANKSLAIFIYSVTRKYIQMITYDYLNDIWNENARIYLNTSSYNFVETEHETLKVSFDIFNNTFNAIKNKSNDSRYTKAIISFLNNVDNSIYSLYINTSETRITISNLYKNVELTNIKTTDVETFKLHNNGFTYIANKSGELFRLFPDNDVNCFGVKNVNTQLQSVDFNNTVGYTTHDGVLYLMSEYSEIVAIDTLTGERIYDRHINDNIRVLAEKSDIRVVENTLYIFATTTDNDIYRVKIDITRDNISVISNDVLTDIQGINASDILRLKFGSFNSLIIEINDNDSVSRKVYDIINDEIISTDTVTARCINENYEYDIFNKVLSIYNKNSLKEKIVLPFNVSDTKIQNENIYLLNAKGYVFVIRINPFDGSISSSKYEYYTDLTSFNNCIITDSKIIDMNRRIEFSNTLSIDSNHYCFDANAISEDDVIISIHNDIDNSVKVYLYDKYTHKLIRTTDLADSDIDLSGKKFVYKNGDIYYYCILTDGSISVIDTNTGEITTLTDNRIHKNNHVIKSLYNKCIVIGNETSSYITLDITTLTIKEKTVHLGEYILDKVLYISNYFRYFYALVHLPSDETYSLGKFDGNIYSNEINSLSFLSKTDIVIDNDLQVLNNNFGILLRTKKSLYAIDIDNERNRLFNIYSVNDDVLNDKCVDEKSLIDFRHDDRVFHANNDVDINSIFGFDNNYKTLSFKLSDKINVAFGRKNDTNTIIFHDNQYNTIKELNSDIVLNNEDYKTLLSNTNTYYDEALDITKIGNFVSIINNKPRSISFRLTGNVNIDDIDETTNIDLIYNDGLIELPDLNNDACLISIQNRYVAIIDTNDIYVYTLSNSWRCSLENLSLESNLILNNDNVKILCIGDIIYFINTNSGKTYIITNPYNGTLYDVIDGHTYKEIQLSSKFLANLRLINHKILYADNNRICSDDVFGVYFNTLKNCSEFYNRYIGVAYDGEVIDAEHPINEFEISFIDTSKETNLLALRSVENIKTTLNLIYKSDEKSLVAEVNAISRLNASKFKILFSNTNLDKTGEVYAFLNESSNGSLVRDDTSYYKGNYSVAIIRNSIIKINVDNEIYTYYRANDEIPLSNEILPIVINYGVRNVDNENTTDTRYLSFVDIKGNIVTYDKELKTFIDISGYVDIDVPHFSTEAMIYPSKIKTFNDDNIITINKVIDEE